jgi:signal transduction histidine kinase
MGVGLYISRESIFHHGGSMRVSSEEGKGSTFCFSVPYAPQREQEEFHS